MEIKLFHSNDIHSYLSNYDKISRYIKDQRSEYKAMLYVDIGDHVDRSHPYTEATLGKGNVDILNESTVDVVTIGNNEGITLNFDDFNALYNHAQFEVTCCNLFDEQNQLPNNIKKSVIKEIEGIRFGFVGATAEFTPFYKSLGWQVTEPIEAIRNEVINIQSQVDVIVILSHLGKFADRRIAEEIEGIDIILGAHTHHYFETGEIVNGVLIGAAGRYGNYLGEITLTFEGNQLCNKTATLIDTDALRNMSDDYYERGKKLLSEKVTSGTFELPRRLFSASYTTAFLAHALKDYLNADCALINSGLIVKGYSGEHFTNYHLHAMLPHPINPVKIKLSGRELKEVINMSFQHEHKHDVIKGFGFRGDVFGMYVLDNIGYIKSSQSYFVNNTLIDNHKTYVLATLDMYTFGRFFPQFVHNEKEYIMPEFLRDVMASALIESK